MTLMMMRRDCTSVVLFWAMIVMAGLSSTTTTAFVTTTTTTAHQNKVTAIRTTFTQVSAKKVKRKTTPSSTNSAGGGGFGKAPAADAAKSSSSAGTVIPFSGHSGSGTKALRKVANQFDAIRKEHGVSACRDVYVRSPLHSASTFWFVGKIACVPTTLADNDDTDNNAVDAPHFVQTSLLLKRIILEYSKDQLRPQAMGGKYASALELWLAPGDSEMDVATNKVNLLPVRGSLSSFSTINLAASDIGYNPEIYVGDERVKGGLHVERDENGVTTKPPFEPNLSQ
uniref:Uncharacterized protein n=1 Tax=Amphora coffeiformis TaxID=265554 RepID=A0A7S3KW06_9STRA|mmetsp:Transcript_11976/g.22887  ORF Transcript_11976/g.22887 Transcript_11976/m.22887 type:complete len:284 (+) Transcript_11976:249-1100(+)